MLQGEPFLDIKCLHLNKLEYNSEMKIKKKNNHSSGKENFVQGLHLFI